MYESPIKVVQGELETQLEGEILKAVHRGGVAVDRDELIRALRYDREQYQKGFDDAKRDAAERLESQKKENAELAEQLKSQTAKTIALRNDLMAEMHSNAVMIEQLDQMNGKPITRENEIASLKADADVLRNKLADTEAARHE